MLIAFALVAVAFGHQSLRLSSSDLSAAELAAYVLPDGSLPVICFGNDGVGSGHDENAGATGCDACRLTSSVILPAPSCDPWRATSDVSSAVPAATLRVHIARAFPPAAPPTAPPLA